MGETYDSSLHSWNYQAPSRIAELWVKYGTAQAGDGSILDCGCGTGISGEALKARGVKNPILGCDISSKSLEVVQQAKPDLYASVTVVNMEVTPYPYEADSLAGVVC